MKLLLQHKVFVGYFLLVAVIGSMAAIILHEHNRVQEIEDESIAIYRIQRGINTAHRYITVLSTYGESAVTWDAEDSVTYRKYRLRTDSLLLALREQCADFMPSSQIDTLRALLASKEEHLLRIVRLLREQEKADSLLMLRLPAVARQVSRLRTVTRTRKGVAGLFGLKETVQLPPDISTLNTLNRELLSIQEERQRDIGRHTDSLRAYNKALNRRLRTLITAMDGQTGRAMDDKEQRLKTAYDRSVSIITCLVISAIVLLALSYLVIQRDIRTKEKVRRRLEKTVAQNAALLEMRNNVILTLSHDIRAPLNIISGNAELAMDTRERRRRNIYLNNVGTVCRHVVRLLNNLLDVYRLNEAKETRNDVPFNLQELLEHIVSGFSRTVNDKGLLFDCDFRDTGVRLLGDADRIEQIMDNLLTNAVKFTETGTIGFKARYKEGELSLEISDTGMGMSEETLSRIFQPFERTVSESNADGFGLGLPITKGLVNLLGGTVDVTSRVGCGSTFRVTLPLPVTDSPSEDGNRILPRPAHLPRNVLVIDDDPMLRDVVREMLERNGVSCTVCSSAKEVVREMRGRDYDLLLSDIQMPGTNGFDLLTLLRNSAIGNSRVIPVVAMTARGDRDKDAYLKAGFTECIYKPFSSQELLGLISAVEGRDGEETKVFDFSAALSEVDDKERLLRSFIAQSRKDMEGLGAAMEETDRKQLREITHRMQPVWEWLRAKERLAAYRNLLKDEMASDNAIKDHTGRIMDYTAILIKEAEEEIKRLKDETENTDS